MPTNPIRRNRAIAGVAVVAVVAVGAVGTALAGASSPSGYRTALVTRSTVVRQLHGSGTISPAARVAVAFPSAGTVARVAVQTGDKVTVGEQLAALDVDSLQTSLDSANATLAKANLTLEQVETGQAVTASGRGFGGSGSSRTGSTGTAFDLPSGVATDGAVPTGADGSSSPTVVAASLVATGPTSGGDSLEAQVKAAQQALIQLQKQLDTALQTARADLAAATAACTPGSPTSTSSTSTTTPAATTSGACTTGQQRSLDDQAGVASLEAQVLRAETHLDQLLGMLGAGRSGSGSGNSYGNGSTGSGDSGGTGTSGGSTTRSGSGPGSSGPGSSGAGTGRSGSVTGSSGSSSTTTSTAPTAAQLAAAQASVDAAAAGVAVAEQAMAAATIVSPISGTVTSVTLKPGDAVTAASTTADIIIVGPGGFEVSMPVSVDDRAALSLGDAASVTPDATGRPVAGKVVSIAVAGTSSGTTTTYTAVIGLTGATSGLRDGAPAATSITVDSQAGAIAVPTSAVRTSGTVHTVTVLSGGKTRTVVVRIGTVGAALTVVRSGLEVGQRVVLATLATPLPSSASNAVTTGRGGFARFGGGAGFGGGARFSGGGTGFGGGGDFGGRGTGGGTAN